MPSFARPVVRASPTDCILLQRLLRTPDPPLSARLYTDTSPHVPAIPLISNVGVSFRTRGPRSSALMRESARFGVIAIYACRFRGDDRRSRVRWWLRCLMIDSLSDGCTIDHLCNHLDNRLIGSIIDSPLLRSLDSRLLFSRGHRKLPVSTCEVTMQLLPASIFAGYINLALKISRYSRY